MSKTEVETLGDKIDYYQNCVVKQSEKSFIVQILILIVLIVSIIVRFL